MVEHQLNVLGHRCVVRISGRPNASLPPMVFLGGAFQSLKSWSRFEQAFAPRTEVVLVDLPGSGNADVLPASYGSQFLADALHDVVDTLRLSPIYLVAPSYASPVGYHFARRHARRVSHLVLTGTTSLFGDRQRESVSESLTALRKGRMETFTRLVVDGLLNRYSSHRVERRRLAERVLARGLLRMGDADRRKYEANTLRILAQAPLTREAPLTTPSLVFTGEHDRFTPPSDGRRIAEQLGSSFTTIRNADHLFHIEQPETAIDLLSRFLHGDMGSHVPGCSPLEPAVSPTEGSAGAASPLENLALPA